MERVTAGWARRRIGNTSEATAAESATPPRRLTTFFDDGCQVDGRLVIKTSIEIDGEFRGRIESEDTVSVRAEASIEGSVRARSIRVEGAVVGDLEASREIVIAPSGRVHGDLSAPSVVIERGAFFNGRTRMYRPEIVVRQSDERAGPSA